MERIARSLSRLTMAVGGVGTSRDAARPGDPLQSDLLYIHRESNLRTSSLAHSLNETPSEAVGSEVDVLRASYQRMKPVLRAAFYTAFLLPRSQGAPTGPTNSPMTVDYQLT